MTYHKEMGIAFLYSKKDDMPYSIVVYGDGSWDAFPYNNETIEELMEFKTRDAIDRGLEQESILERYYLK